jgi:hypothetical protein
MLLVRGKSNQQLKRYGTHITHTVALEPKNTVSIKAWNNEVCLENRNNN